MSVICDVCTLPRPRGSHELCSKIRQAAGFTPTVNVSSEHGAMKEADGWRPDLNIRSNKAQLAQRRNA